MYNKVFISYASEDIDYANRLYAFLIQKNYKPWLDKNDLIPGQQWEIIIQSELRKSDFIILLLSNKSVLKRGYVQQEFNTAVKYCQEKLDEDIYIIPVKIDNCDIPEKLSKFQWVDYSDNDSFQKILSALSSQKEKLLKERTIQLANQKGFTIIEKTKFYELGITSPKQIIDIKFQAVEPISESISELNTLIENEALKQIMSARKNYFDHLEHFESDEDNQDALFSSDSECFGNINLTFTGKNFVSYKCFWSIYHTGAIHGFYWTEGQNFYIDPFFEFDFLNLFSDIDSALVILRDVVHAKLMVKAEIELGVNRSDFYLLEEGIQNTKDYFDNYYFKDSSIFFIYNPYELTAFALGDHHVEITRTELLNLFKYETKLITFLNEYFI